MIWPGKHILAVGRLKKSVTCLPLTHSPVFAHQNSHHSSNISRHSEFYQRKMTCYGALDIFGRLYSIGAGVESLSKWGGDIGYDPTWSIGIAILSLLRGVGGEEPVIPCTADLKYMNCSAVPQRPAVVGHKGPNIRRAPTKNCVRILRPYTYSNFSSVLPSIFSSEQEQLVIGS